MFEATLVQLQSTGSHPLCCLCSTGGRNNQRDGSRSCCERLVSEANCVHKALKTQHQEKLILGSTADTEWHGTEIRRQTPSTLHFLPATCSAPKESHCQHPSARSCPRGPVSPSIQWVGYASCQESKRQGPQWHQAPCPPLGTLQHLLSTPTARTLLLIPCLASAVTLASGLQGPAASGTDVPSHMAGLGSQQ